jgi:hypothetical protein
MITRVSKAEPITGAEGLVRIAGITMHGASVQQSGNGCQHTGVSDKLGPLIMTLPPRFYARSALFTLLVGLPLLVAASVASAQAPPTLGEAITEWARGNWASPVFCKIGGQTVRGIRRVLIDPPQRPFPGRTELDVQFVDMDVDDAERCFDLVGTEIPNLTGKLKLRFNGTSHPETVRQDFERALKRDRGFVFSVRHGRVERQIVKPGENESSIISLKDTEAWIRRPAPGSDAAHALAEFESRRKLEIEISVPEGPSYVLPLFLMEPR